MIGRRYRLLLLLLICALLQSGCAQFAYYAQAIDGQLRLMAQSKPVDEWLNQPDLTPALHDKLLRARQIRRFAVTALDLPDNRSYTEYADIGRPFVLWNVVATPELSLTPKNWCFPIAGCVSYRGYYRQVDAKAFAEELRRQGYDVQVSGVPAYSTLGWLNDPLLSSFIFYPDSELAKLIFHELAHQIVYIKGDTQFNESFATAVEEAGITLWLEQFGNAQLRAAHTEHQMRKREFLALLVKHRKELELNYNSGLDDERKRQRKAQILKALKSDYQALKIKWNGYAGYDRWFAENLSNAHLALISLYHDYVPAFQALLIEARDFSRFYARVKELSLQSRDERDRRLRQSLPTAVPQADPVGSRN